MLAHYLLMRPTLLLFVLLNPFCDDSISHWRLYDPQDKQTAELERISKIIKSNPIGKAQMLAPSLCIHLKVLDLKKHNTHNIKVYLRNISPT